MGILKAVPDPPTFVTPCACPKCRTLYAKIYFEDRASLNLAPAELAARWHEVEPFYQAARERFPSHAAHVACSERTSTAAVAALVRWDHTVSAETNIAVLSGPPGTGKTVAATFVALYLNALEDPMFVTARRLSRASRADFDDLLGASLLVVDDLGTELLDDRFVADFDELVDRFYQDDGGLVITTNCTAKEFRARYGARVVDRLAERGEWINVGGKSMRKRDTDTEVTR